MIDVHCHVLPGIDDGPKDMGQAVALAQALVNDGISHVCATAHWTPGVYHNHKAQIAAAAEQLKAELHQNNINLNVTHVTEARLHVDLLDELALESISFLGQDAGYRILLLEFPDAGIPPGSLSLVNTLFRQQIRPLIVHPERNKAVMADVDALRPFVESGCWVQLTAGSLLGDFGRSVLKTSLALLDLNWVDVIASDAHNLKYRPPRMELARNWLEQHEGKEFAQELTRTKAERWLSAASA